MTGVGLVSPLGIGTEANWEALCAGRSGIGPITRFDAAQFSARIAGEVKDFDPLQFIEKKDVKKMDVFIQFAIAASQFAMDDAGLQVTPDIATRVGVFIASGIGGFSTIEREHKALLEGGPRRISPFFIPAAIINLAAGQVSIRFGAKGPNSATCTACSASAHAIGDAFEIIRRDDADVMIAGGSEAAITPMGVGGFAAMRALSTRNDEPQHASRPFDQDRDGFIMGEGAGRHHPRGARVRPPPRRADLRRAGRLRHVRRRVPHHRAVRGRRRRHARMETALNDAGVQPAAGRLHQRPRHLDALQRQARDAGDQAAVRRARRNAGDLVDQVDDRPPARRRRRARSRHHRAGDQAPADSADDQLRARPIPSATSTTCRTQARPMKIDVRAVELVRLRRHQRGAAVQEIRE